MSTTIDERVVEMKFDNSTFESNVQTSLSTLDKLKAALKLDGATKGLESVNATAKNMDFSGMSISIEGLTHKFSILEEFATGAIRNIANDITNKLKNAINSVTLEPIMAGFKEYNTQMNAVQTILANTKSKGSTIDDVNKSLNELNEYADQTIYNFTEMTNNIGRFTAAGVDLETSTKSIKGISNLAAVAGSTTQQASTAMYQLSQAISSGALKLQDWNSVVNAGMGGEAFQNALKQTSRAMVKLQGDIANLAGQGKSAEEISQELGISLEKVQKLSEQPYEFDVDQAIADAGSFRESLKDGWITADVLTETLGNLTISYKEVGDEQYQAARQTLLANGYLEDEVDAILDLAKTAGDAATQVKTIPQLFDTLTESVQSGWTQTWNYIIGDFEEAKELLSGASKMITEIFDGMSTSRNEFWKAFHDNGSRASVIDAITASFKVLMGIVTPVSEAISTLFPKITVDQMQLFCAGLAVAAEALEKLVTEHQTEIRNFALAIISPLKLILSIGKVLIGFISKIAFGVIRTVFDIFVSIGSVIYDVVTAFNSAKDSMTKSSQGMFVAERALIGLDKVLKAVGSAVTKFITSIKESETLKLFVDLIKELAKQFGLIVGSAIVSFIVSLSITLHSLAQTIKDFTKGFREFVSEVIDKVKNTATFKKLSDQLKPLNKNVGTLSDTVTTFAGNVKRNLGGKFSAAVEAVKSFFGSFIKLPSADNVAGFIERILGVVSWLIDKVKGGGQSIKDFFSSFMAAPKDGEKAVGVIEKVKEKLAALKDMVLGLFSKKDAGAEGGVTIADRIKNMFGSIDLSKFDFGEKFAKIGEFLKKTFGNWHLETIFDVAKAGSLAYFLIKIGSFFKSFSGITKSGLGIVDSCKDMVDSMSGVFDATAKQMNADAMKHIAEAIAIIAGAIFALGFMDEDALVRSAFVVGVIIFLLTKLSDGTKKADIKDVAADKLANVKESLSGFLDGMKDAFQKAAKLVGMAAIIVALGITVGILVVCIHSLAKLNQGEGGLEAARHAVGMIAAMLAVLITAILLISNFAGDKASLKAALIIVSLAGAVKKMSKSVQELAKVPYKALWRGVGAVAALSACISVMALASSGSKMASLSLGMTLVAAAMTLLLVPITVLGNMDVNALKQGLISLGIIVTLLTIIGALASSSLAGATSILIISAAMLILTPALVALGLAAPIALVGILALAAGFVVFGVAGLLLTPIAPILLMVAAALAVSVVALLAAGAGFWLIVSAMGAFATGLLTIGMALPAFANGLVAFSNTISANAENVKNGFLTLILSISQALIIGVPTIMITIRVVVAAVIIGLCMAIQDAVNPIVDTILVAFVAVCNGVAKYSETIFNAIITVIISLIKAVVSGVDKLLEWVRLHGIDQISRIFFSLEIFIASAIKGFFDSIAAMGIPVISGLAEDVSGAVDGFIGNIEEKISEIDLKSAVEDKFGEAAEGATEGTSAFESATSGVGDLISNKISGWIDTSDLQAKGQEAPESVAAGMESGAPTLDESANAIFGTEGGLGSTLAALPGMGTEGGEGLMTNLTSSVTDGTPGFLGAVTNMFNGGEEGGGLFGDTSVIGSDAVTNLFGSMGSSIEEFAPDMQSKLTDSIQFDTEAINAKGAEQGKNVDDGMAQGVEDNKASVLDTVKNLATSVLGTSAEELGINSPSTKFAEQGRYIDEGLEQGIKDNQSKVSSALTSLVTSAVRAVSNQASKFKTEGGKVPTNFASGVTSGVEKVKNAATKMATSAATAAGSKAESFKQAGSDAVTQFVNGLGTQNEEITKAGSNAGDTFVSGVKGKSSSANGAGSTLASNAVTGAASRNGTTRNPATFYSVGQDAGEGFIVGINSKAQAAAKAAADLANAALNAAKKTIDSNSPSKKFMELGEYSSEGFAIGMTNLTSMVAKSSGSVAQTAIDSVTGAVKRFNTLSSRDASLKPVISPIIDTNSAISNIRGLNKAVTLAQGMATTARISETVEASYTVNHDQAEMQAMLRGMYACMMEYFPQFADNKYAVLTDGTVNSLTRTINRRLGAQLL